jgi:hypothetical protein
MTRNLPNKLPEKSDDREYDEQVILIHARHLKVE